MSDTVAFLGEEFQVADKIGLMPLMRFAKVARSGIDSNDMEGLASLLALLEQCIADEDWSRFEAHAEKHRADGDELMAVVSDVFEKLSQRPTSRPSDSSDGPPTTEQRSPADSFSPVIDRLTAKGRPDLAVIVRTAQESQAS